MLREFAVEPALLKEFSAFKFLRETFGVSEARMIAEFPKKWKRMVYEATSNFTDRQKQQLVSWLQDEKEKFLIPSGRAYDARDNWLNNAENADLSQPFHAILATANPTKHEKVLIHDDISSRHPLFKAQRSCYMPKTVDGFAATSSLLLKISHESIFIDPYAKADKRWEESLSKMLNNVEPASSILYFAIDDEKMEEKSLRLERIQEFWPRYIPKGMQLEFILLDKDAGRDTHNRYILTERGGIQFPWGLDTRSDGAKDLIYMMDEDTHKTMFKEYKNLTGRTVRERIQVAGSKS